MDIYVRSVRNARASAFTLVELIVVISILAILATAGFLSIQGYSVRARDSSRVSDLANISKGLDLLIAKGNSLPIPGAPSLDITASGTIIGRQGYAGTNVLSAIWIWGGTKDPLDGRYYTYLTNAGQTKYQLLALLELGDNPGLTMDIPGTDTAYAASYDARSPLLRGSQLGILLGTATGSTLNQPVQELYNGASFTGVDVVNTEIVYNAVFSKSDTVSGTGLILFTNISNRNAEIINNINLASLDASLVGYWDMETLSGALLKDLSGKGNNGGLSNGLLAGKVRHSQGQATGFNGLNDHIEVPPVPSLSYKGDTDITISTWIYVNSTETSGWHVFAKPWNGRGEYNYSLRAIANTWAGVRLDWYSGNTSISTSLVSSYIRNNEWTHVAVQIKKNGDKKIYINGQPDAVGRWQSGQFTPVSWDDNLPLSIGTVFPYSLSWTWRYEYSLDGNIDDFRIYNRALSDMEIQFLYNSTK